MKSRRWGLKLTVLPVLLGLVVSVFSVALQSQIAKAAAIDDVAAVICANNTTDGRDKCVSNVIANPSKSVVCTAVFDYGNFDTSNYGDCGRVYDEGYKADSQTTASQSAGNIGITQVGVNGVPAATIAEIAYLAAHNTASNPPVTTVSYSQKAQDYCNGKYPDMGNFTTDCMKGYDNPDGNGVCSDTQTAANCIDGQNAAKNSDEYKAAQKSKEAANTCASKYASSTSYSYSTGQYDSTTHKLIIATMTENGACVFGYSNKDTDKICESTYVTSQDGSTKDDYKKLVEACDSGKASALAANPDPVKTGSDDKDPCYAADTQGFGWVACPGINWLTRTIDWIVGWITGGLQWTMLTDASGGTTIKTVWNSMLAIANIAFAIVFLIIIYSTATSSGLSNYSVKKILPRLVIGAIGVNLSFYICAAAADLSNIAGVGIKSLILDQLTGANNTGQFGDLLNGVWQLAGGILIAILAWSMVLIGLVTVFFAIALRSVLLTMLVIISPIAIVAALLPNTEKWFKKWRDTFIQLLVVYPAFMAAWAACRLVSNIVAQTEGIGWLLSALCTIAPLAIIIPLFKATSGLMGKMTGLAEKGIGMAGGNALKKINQEQRQLAGQRALSGLRGVATRGLGDKKRNMDLAASQLDELKKDKESRPTFSAAENKRLGELSALGALRTSEQQKEFNALNAKRVNANKNGWTAADEEKLSNAQRKADSTANTYRRQTNGLLYRTTFGGAHRRAAIANIKSENDRADQDALGRRLGEDENFQRRYSGVAPFMDQANATERVNRVLSQAQAIGDKRGAEEREQFKSFLGNVPVVDANGVAANEILTNAMAMKLMTQPGYTVKLANGRELSFDAMTDNEKLTLFQQASGGSTPEVADLRDATTRFTDPALRQAAANMVIQSGNKDFLVQGANNMLYGTGQAGSHAEQLIRVTQAPLEAGTLDRYTKPAFWDASIKGLTAAGGVADMARSGDAKAQKSLENLAGAIQAQLQQNGAAKVVQAVGNEYEQILKAYNAMPGASTIDIGALFASARSK